MKNLGLDQELEKSLELIQIHLIQIHNTKNS
jgi:hypothetical protein